MQGHAAFRDRFATSPHDLSEYAREQTGPASWSAHPEAEALSRWALSEHDDPHAARTTELLSRISPLDVPFVTVRRADAEQILGHRETFVMSAIDGRSTCEMLVDTIDLPPGDVLTILCNLCARGLVVLGDLT